MNRTRIWLSSALLVFAATAATAETAPRPLDAAPLDRAFGEALEEHGNGIEGAAWVGTDSGDAWYACRADAEMPTASAIKTAFLIELFAAYSGKLDEPVPGLDALLDDDDHPAFEPFESTRRDEIREGLRGITPRRLGEVMTGHVSAPNHVSNAAASFTTALLGGPEGLTEKIAARDPAFAPIRVRRYMLADRTAAGDNTATPEALAAVLQRLASRQLDGIDAETVEAIREAMVQAELPDGGGRAYIKNGALASNPQTRVQAGWRETPRGTVVYVLMTAQPGPGDLPRKEAASRLSKTARALSSHLIDVAEQALPARPTADVSP